MFKRENYLTLKHLCNKQENLCVSLWPKTKRDYLKQLNNKVVSDNRKFWKQSPIFRKSVSQ